VCLGKLPIVLANLVLQALQFYKMYLLQIPRRGRCHCTPNGCLGRVKWILALNQSCLNEEYIVINVLKAMNSVVSVRILQFTHSCQHTSSCFPTCTRFQLSVNYRFSNWRPLESTAYSIFFSQVHKRSITLSLVLNPSGNKIINQNEIGLFLECSGEELHIPDFVRPHG